ncbi:hypothetical protein PHLCEN_2v1445 [Hermanssonia centrifuga]|uniref:LigT-like protein n=1 Tax=Hermanssonia centrifuga TaxID=98765 RepID=A0A2R6S022_9APHY|nr:hypothetical protein PHLCEN_2v1445 [Hermanssonia centrifuga]
MNVGLWLVPPADIAARLGQFMSLKPGILKSASSFPHFPPHINLATVPTDSGGLYEELYSLIPRDYSAIPVTFKAVKIGGDMFPSLHVEIHDTGSLRVLRSIIANKLSEKSDEDPPRLALFYLHDDEPEERTRFMEELIHANRIVERGPDGVALDCTKPLAQDITDDDLVSGFVGGEIWIVRYDVTNSYEWRIMKDMVIKLIAE